MLQLKGIFNTAKEIMESDFYIPIKVKFESMESGIEHNLYWRTGNFLEIGISPTNGTIISITLLAASKVFVSKKQKAFDEYTEKFGLPSFKTDKWKNGNYYVDEDRDKDFEVYIYENNVNIVLDPHKIKTKIINNRVDFGFDGSNLLCSIEVKDLNYDEMSLLKESFHGMKAI